MKASVQGGSLERWFEELCRLKVNALKDLTIPTGMRLKPRILPTAGGVYAFWWTGFTKLLRNSHRDLSLIGPGGRRINLHISDDWFGLDTELPVPLYVGKTAANLQKRIGQHLLLKTERALLLNKGTEKAKPPTTSCQLRAGIDHLFPNEPNTRTLVLENIGLSYVVLDGDLHPANRFYLEDMAIGHMRPPLNVDIER